MSAREDVARAFCRVDHIDPDKIVHRFTTISPGGVETEIVRRAWQDNLVRADQAIAALAPLRDAEIAAAVAKREAEIVAWLRATPVGFNFEATNANEFADAIERGDHNENGNG